MGMLDGLGGTGILSTMKYVNIEQKLPQTTIHQEQAIGERNGYVPVEMHRNLQLPRSEMGWTQLKIDIDCYPSRTAYGFLNNTDFAQKYGQQGFQDLAASTSRHTQEAWAAAKGAARPHSNLLGQQAKSRFWSETVKWPQWVAEHIPDPEFTVHPQEVTGQMDIGQDKYDIQTTDHADIAIKTGTAETSLATEGSIRMWTTEGRLDVRV